MKRSFKILALLLCLALLIGGAAVSSGAADIDPNAVVDTEGSRITRISAVVNGDTETSRGVCWATKTRTESVVLVSENEDLSGAKAFTGGDVVLFMGYYMHKVVVNGLRAGKTYYYTVGDKSTRSPVCSFTTDPGRGEPIDFLVYADVQASNEENFERAARVVNAVYDLYPDIDFTTSMGDYVNDCTNEEWDYYFEKFAFIDRHTTNAPVAGNHDGNLRWNWFDSMFNLGAAEGSDTITGVYYSFDYGDAHFAVLNTNDMYPMSYQQQNWLKNDMNATNAKWKIVMLHRSIYSAGKHTNKPDSSIMRNVLVPIIDELGIDLVIGGHEHCYVRTYPVTGDGVMPETTYVTELYNGEETTFAVDPAGSIHVMPSTAGTKRYLINENTMQYIVDASAKMESTRDKGGVAAHVEINGDYLVFKTYLVDDETYTPELYDVFGIKKTTDGAANEDWEDLPTDFESNNENNVLNFLKQIIWMLFHYLFKVLPGVIVGN
ncbi:MAG: metallophosphoesterase family protein [Clostridia bacterium]|nr:metallophosphoesterase family protein [Clostridia bacterium]